MNLIRWFLWKIGLVELIWVEVNRRHILRVVRVDINDGTEFIYIKNGVEILHHNQSPLYDKFSRTSSYDGPFSKPPVKISWKRKDVLAKRVERELMNQAKFEDVYNQKISSRGARMPMVPMSVLPTITSSGMAQPKQLSLPYLDTSNE